MPNSKSDIMLRPDAEDGTSEIPVEIPEEELEFGGTAGAIGLIVFSHSVLYYFWYCYEVNRGRIILPGLRSGGEFGNETAAADFFAVFVDKAVPSLWVWINYTIFFIGQIGLAYFIPGRMVKGLEIKVFDKRRCNSCPAVGSRLDYFCNGYLCYYAVVAALLAGGGIFGWAHLTHLVDNFGQYLTAAVIIADATSIYWFVYGKFVVNKDRKFPKNSNWLYEFFMGAILYPRMLNDVVDIKMVAECRWSWLTLFLITASACVKQLIEVGWSWFSAELAMLLLAHWLYSNATVKGEHYIPGTWDMFRERYGWMLNFWNIAGVPYLYCFQSLYVYKNYAELAADRSLWNIVYLVFCYLLLVVGYYIFDTANMQKASYKLPEHSDRRLFPTFSYGLLKEPVKVMKTPKGNLLIDGWYGRARKMQYTGDIMMALSWGLICGFGSPLPYFYVVFFTSMIVHRQLRDMKKCKDKYGSYWEDYCKQVPYTFIPGIL